MIGARKPREIHSLYWETQVYLKSVRQEVDTLGDDWRLKLSWVKLGPVSELRPKRTVLLLSPPMTIFGGCIH